METCQIWKKLPHLAKMAFKLACDGILSDILQNYNTITLFCFRRLLDTFTVATGSVGHDVAGTKRGPVASHNLSKVEQVILKFWFHSSVNIADYHLLEIPHPWPLPRTRGLPFQPSTHSTPTLLLTQNNGGKCNCRNEKKISRPKFRTSAAIFREVRKHIFLELRSNNIPKILLKFLCNPVMETPASLLTAKRKTVTMIEGEEGGWAPRIKGGNRKEGQRWGEWQIPCW